MASKNETVKAVIAEWRLDVESWNWIPSKDAATARIDRIEAAHKREVESYKRLLMTSQCALEDEIVKNQNLKREVAELRECLKEAIKKQCKHKECKNNVCFFVEFGKEDECVVYKWRKALKGAKDGK